MGSKVSEIDRSPFEKKRSDDRYLNIYVQERNEVLSIEEYIQCLTKEFVVKNEIPHVETRN